MVLEEGLDISSLPRTLKEEFDQLYRLEGRFRVTNLLVEVVDLEDLDPREVPPCSACKDVKEDAEKMKTVAEKYKPTITFSKVIE